MIASTVAAAFAVTIVAAVAAPDADDVAVTVAMADVAFVDVAVDTIAIAVMISYPSPPRRSRCYSCPSLHLELYGRLDPSRWRWRQCFSTRSEFCFCFSSRS